MAGFWNRQGVQPSAMGITCKGVATRHRVECCDYAAHLKSGLHLGLFSRLGLQLPWKLTHSQCVRSQRGPQRLVTSQKLLFRLSLRCTKTTKTCVSRRERYLDEIYACPQKTYIGLRIRVEDAVKRAEHLFAKNCEVRRHSLLILRVQVTALGFAKYATMLSGSESNFAPMLHKIVYEYDKSFMDWGVWYFHGDLPLRDSAADGQVLITSEWMEIL